MDMDAGPSSSYHRVYPPPPLINPLDIDIILDLTLHFIPTPQLLQCRLISSHWKHVADLILLKRRDHIVTLTCLNSSRFMDILRSTRFHLLPFPSVRWKCWAINHERVRHLLETLMEKGGGGGIKVFELDMDCKHKGAAGYCILGHPDDRPQTTADLVNKLLAPLSSSLEVLDMDEVTPQIATPSSTIPEIQCTFPFLKKIIFPAQEQYFCSKTWERVFHSCPSLREVDTNHKLHTGPVITALVNSGRLENFSSLRLENMSSHHLKIMLDTPPSMKLKEFRVNIIEKDVGRWELERFLQKFSQSLEILVFGSPEDDGKLRVKLPKMAKLKELGLFHLDDSLVTLEDLRFHEDMPELKKLSVSTALQGLNWKDYFSYIDERNIVPCGSVEELKLATLITDPRCCNYLSKLFANVKTLSLDFPRAPFLKKVWTCWPSLMDLYLYFPSSKGFPMDVGVCGIPLGFKKEMDPLLGNLTVQDVLEKGRSLEINCGISNLKNLRRFVVETTPGKKQNFKNPPVPLLTDLGVYLSLAQLKELRVLKVARSQISTTALTYLKRENPLLSPTDIDVRGPDGPGLFSFEEKSELIDYMEYYRGTHYNHQRGV